MKQSPLPRRGLTLAVGFLWMLSLDSCTIYKDPLLVKYDDLAQRREVEDLLAKSKTINTPAPIASAPDPVATSKVKIEACARFVLPPNGTIPRLTQKQIEDIALAGPSKDTTNTLVDELEKIYKYTSAEENALNTAYVKHLKTCRKVAVVK